MTQTGFSDLRHRAMQQGARCLSVAGGNDPEVMKAVETSLAEGLVSQAIVTGDASIITAAVPAVLREKLVVIDAHDALSCAAQAVDAVRTGRADVLMKGHIDSTSYLRAIVNRETGIRHKALLSNVTVAEMPSYHKLIGVTDNGIVPQPTIEQKRQIVQNTASLFHGLGVDNIKVAVVTATEKVSREMPSTQDAAQLVSEGAAGRFPGFTLGGPFGYDVAVSKAAALAKRLDASPVAGDADLLLFSSIEAANAVAKAWKLHGQAQTGSILLGAKVPVLLNSRSDSVARRINALLLALSCTEASAQL